MKLTHIYVGMFITNNPATGEPCGADSIPIITVYKNGEINTDIVMTVSESDPSINQGVYKITADGTWENSSFAVDDKVDIYVYTTINGVDSHAIIDSFTLDTGYEDSHTWHVAKTGNDSNDGHSFTDALLTIPAAITAASAGDTIYIHPGTYDKDADGGAVILNKTLTIIGSGQGKTIITNGTSNYAIQIIADNVKVSSLSAEATYLWLTLGGYGIFINGVDNVIIDNCYAYGYGDGIYLSTSPENCKITNTIGKSRYDGINVVDSIGTFIDKCTFITTGDFDTTKVIGITSSANCDNLTIKDTQVIASRAVDGASYHITGIETYGNTILDNVNITVYNTGTGLHTTKGIDVISGKLLANKINVNVVASEGTAYDITNTGGEIVINNSLYDSNQTSGTIIDKTNSIVNQTDQLSFTGTDINATLDGEVVTTDNASRIASQADISTLATSSNLALAQLDLDTITDTGVDLKSTGLDNILATEPTGRASTFREMIVQTWMRFFNKVDKTSTQIRVYDADGVVITTQSHSEAGETVTVDKSS